jgi:hypothetical protein
MSDLMQPGTEALSKTSLLVPKLKEDGSNWVLYRTRLLDYIYGQKGYRKHLMGRVKAPTPLTEEEQRDEDKVEEFEDQMDEFTEKQSAILLGIHSNCRVDLTKFPQDRYYRTTGLCNQGRNVPLSRQNLIEGAT